MKTSLALNKINEVTQKITSASSAMMSVTASTAMTSLSRQRDALLSPEAQKLVAHYASLKSPQALLAEVSQIGQDLGEAAPQTVAVIKEIAGLRKNLLKKALARLNAPSETPTADAQAETQA